MTRPAYYNEIDPFAAQTLRNLIKAGYIAPGDVDERSILDVCPDDLRGYAQCHFFAGVGVWSYALRRAGWPDDREIWTGSCPCQPFSVAGVGGGFGDERHLWPFFHHLIRERRPAAVLGEQVASRDADPWIDLVQDDMEAVDYAFGAIPFPSAGVGAPHIRDRLYWVAYAHRDGCESGREGRTALGHWPATEPDCRAGWLAHAEHGRCGAGESKRTWPSSALSPGFTGGRVDAVRDGRRTRRDDHAGNDGPIVDTTSPSVWLGHASGPRLDERERERRILGGAPGAVKGETTVGAGIHALAWPGPTNGLWRDADWLRCRDGKWRPVEPGTFPLAYGAPARVGCLRAYGNAINAEAARVFIEAVMPSLYNPAPRP